MGDSKKFIFMVGFGVMVVAIILLLGGSGNQEQTALLQGPQQTETPSSGGTSGLDIKDVVLGTGREAVCDTAVTVDYTGWLTDGTKFDSSLDRGVPFQFPLCAGQVIRGWDLGVTGMKVGGTRRLTIPPDLAYGNQAIGPIPSGSTLTFEVQLLNVEGVTENKETAPEQQ